jgi:hypothetical protein
MSPLESFARAVTIPAFIEALKVELPRRLNPSIRVEVFECQLVRRGDPGPSSFWGQPQVTLRTTLGPASMVQHLCWERSHVPFSDYMLSLMIDGYVRAAREELGRQLVEKARF